MMVLTITQASTPIEKNNLSFLPKASLKQIQCKRWKGINFDSLRNIAVVIANRTLMECK